MKKWVILIILLSHSTSYPFTYMYNANGLTGGGLSLDGVESKWLWDEDKAWVLASTGAFYMFDLDQYSGASESSPYTIAPDDVDTGDKRWLMQSKLLNYNFQDLADSATPGISGGGNFTLIGTTTITNFTGGTYGDIITLLAGEFVTITDGTNILLSGASNFDMYPGELLVLVQSSDGKWYELYRYGEVEYTGEVPQTQCWDEDTMTAYVKWGASDSYSLFTGNVITVDGGENPGAGCSYDVAYNSAHNFTTAYNMAQPGDMILLYPGFHNFTGDDNLKFDKNIIVRGVGLNNVTQGYGNRISLRHVANGTNYHGPRFSGSFTQIMFENITTGTGTESNDDAFFFYKCTSNGNVYINRVLTFHQEAGFTFRLNGSGDGSEYLGSVYVSNCDFRNLGTGYYVRDFETTAGVFSTLKTIYQNTYAGSCYSCTGTLSPLDWEDNDDGTPGYGAEAGEFFVLFLY